MIIGIPDDRWGESVKAVVVPAPGAELSAHDIIAFCRARLAHYQAPASVDFVEVLPRSATGKVLKRAPAAVTQGSPLHWLAGKRVLVLGCGALGASAAEACARAGVAALHLVDNGLVTPGILVRQPYGDADVGQPKARSLAARLATIGRDRGRGPARRRTGCRSAARPGYDRVRSDHRRHR